VHGPWLPRTPPPSALSAAERAAVLDLLAGPAYADLAIPQVWARELDEGRYRCSVSTMYRIARAAGRVSERRRQATPSTPGAAPGVGRARPRRGVDVGHHRVERTGQRRLVQVLCRPGHLSRYVAGWLVAAAEDAIVAKDFLAEARGA
jgi:putative transposase